MSNNSTQLNVCSRAALAGAFVGAAASSVENWRRYKNGQQDVNQAVANVLKSATKAGVVSGAVMYAANATAGRPLLTLLATLSAASAGLYLLDSLKEKQNGEQQ